MIGGINSVSLQLANLYNTTNTALAETLRRIASGKKIINPSDDFVSYIRAKSLQDDIDDYAEIKENLTEARGVARMAVELGNGIYEDLTRMKDLATLYAGTTDDDELASYNAEFETLAQSIQDTIDNNKYGVNKIVSASTLVSVGIDPSTPANSLDVVFVAGDIISDLSDEDWNLDNDDAGDEDAKVAADVQTEINTIINYLVKAEGYVSKIDRQIDISNTMIESKKATKSLIIDIDEIEELQKLTELQIRQQAAIAMIAQSNMARASVAKLYGF